jgi:hypothetical protein
MSELHRIRAAREACDREPPDTAAAEVVLLPQTDHETPRQQPEPVEIPLGDEPREVVHQALAALVAANDPPAVFVRSGRLCRLIRDENGHGALEPMSEGAMRVALERAACFMRGDGDKRASVPAPRHVIESVRALGSWSGIVAVEAIVEMPVLRPDGTVLDRAGYDAATRLVYDPDPSLQLQPIPAEPTAADVEAALALLLDELLIDFPFVTPADKANSLGLLITPIVRHLVSLVPLAVVDAPRAGSGKGLLAQLVSIIASGRPAAVMVDPADEAEWRKTITSVLEPGNTFVFVDEVSTLRSASLGAALTASDHSGRRLGHTEMIRVPQRATWIAAGNNVQLAGDLPRRAYRIRLDPKMARPWLRKDFRHDDLEGWTGEHRGDLLAALLTLARAWHAAGQPAADVPALGSFGPWAKTVGGILHHANVEGFLGNLAELYDENDEEAREWETFLRSTAEVFNECEFSTSELAAAIDRQQPFADTLPSDLADKRKLTSFKQVLGKALRRHVDTRHGEDSIRIIQSSEDRKNRTPRWQIAVDPSLRETGSAGSALAHNAHDERARAHGHNGGNHSRDSRTPAHAKAAK